jgi:hypothetical protein
MRTMSDIIGAIVATLSHMAVPHKFPNQTGESFSLALNSLGLVDRNVGLMDKGRKGT